MKVRMKIRTLFTCAALALCSKAWSQADIHFSQFYETSMLRNPSLTGIFSNDYKIGAYYRDQWASIGHPYTTMLAFAEFRFAVGHVSDDFVSFGLLGYADKAGSLDQKITSFYPAINYSKCVNPDKNAYLSAGFTAGYTQYSFDRTKVTVDNQFLGGFFNAANPTMENFSNVKMSMWDLGTGINFNASTGANNSTTYMIGISGYHLTQPNFSYYNIPGITQNLRWNANAAIAFNVQDNLSTQFHANFAMQGAYTEAIAGALFTYAEDGGPRPLWALTGGLFYRLQDALIPVVKLKYKNTSIGASYDVNLSKLTPASKMRGGLELTLSLSGDLSDKSGVLKKTVCPKF